MYVWPFLGEVAECCHGWVPGMDSRWEGGGSSLPGDSLHTPHMSERRYKYPGKRIFSYSRQADPGSAGLIRGGPPSSLHRKLPLLLRMRSALCVGCERCHCAAIAVVVRLIAVSAGGSGGVSCPAILRYGGMDR